MADQLSTQTWGTIAMSQLLVAVGWWGWTASTEDGISVWLRGSVAAMFTVLALMSGLVLALRSFAWLAGVSRG